MKILIGAAVGAGGALLAFLGYKAVFKRPVPVRRVSAPIYGGQPANAQNQAIQQGVQLGAQVLTSAFQWWQSQQQGDGSGGYASPEVDSPVSGQSAWSKDVELGTEHDQWQTPGIYDGPGGPRDMFEVV